MGEAPGDGTIPRGRSAEKERDELAGRSVLIEPAEERQGQTTTSTTTGTGSGAGPGSDAFETIFARICLERGWVTREDVARCFTESAAASATSGQGASRLRLSDLLHSKKLISTPQVEVVREEVTRLLRLDAYCPVRQEASLGELLVLSRRITREQLVEALAVQSRCAHEHTFVPMLGQVLVDRGHLSPAALEEALELQRGMIRLRCSSCHTAYLVSEMDPRRIYLCRRCAAPLGRMEASPGEPVEEPAEVRRAAGNPKNVCGKYISVSELGRGGMGAVYKAWDTVGKRWVALKIHVVTGGIEGLVRFRREAETAAALQHPNIVPIYDVGQRGDRHYIAMKYIDGRPLVELKPGIEESCRIMIQVAQAIELAHSKDIVHRDLKPANVLVDQTGRPYVTDFGLAKNLFESFNVTAPGTVMGSPSYMSPEQAAGQISKVDQRSDVYSLGALLYALLAGRPPFKGETPVATVKQVLSDPVVPLATLNPKVPPRLEGIVMRTLAKERGQRFPSAGALAFELERFLTGAPALLSPSASEVPHSPRPRPKAGVDWRVAAALTLFAALSAILLWHWLGR